MTVDRWLRLTSGVLILAGLLLGYFVSRLFYAGTALVGLSLFQGAFTDTCPTMAILRRLGVRD